MTDIALILDPTALSCDLALGNGDLATDDGLRTALLISLFSDRLAEADDELPDNSGDRRGWWGDLPLAGDATSGTDPIGSRLWLLARAKAIPQTARLAELYCREALQWLLDDGVAQRVDVATDWVDTTTLGIAVTVTRQSASGVPVSQVFNLAWTATMAQSTALGG